MPKTIDTTVMIDATIGAAVFHEGGDE